MALENSVPSGTGAGRLSGTRLPWKPAQRRAKPTKRGWKILRDDALVVGIRITPIVAKTLVRYFGRGEGRRSHAGWIFGTIFHFKPVRAISARSAVSRCFFHRGECGFLHYEAM